jgi:superfamily II DNA or RNA helicase
MRDSGILAKLQSWQQFRSAVTALANTKAKGDAFEALCAAFLRTDPRYVAELKSVWLRHEVPAEIAKRLNLPSSDEGIDGIAQTHGGEFWSLQCKFLSNHKATLTKNALDGFAHLSFTHCKGITKALVLHTSSAPIRKHKLLGVSEIGLREFEGLDEAAWAAIRVAASSTSPRAVIHKPRQPRPHQEAAVAAVTTHLQTHDRGRVLMACGSGKSLVGFWVQAAMGAKQVVVAVPSLSLLNQTLKEWATEWAARGERVRYTAVCGDESAADIGDSFVEHAYELGIDTYTDEARIAERLKALRGEHHVVFTTYQSSHRLAAAVKAAKHSFDLGILDEAHKTVGEWGGRFTTLLHPKVPIRKRIAMTATERVLRGADDRVLSMDDPKVYGEVAFSYTFKAAIADGVICDYKIITLAVSESRIRELIKDNAHLLLKGKGGQDKARLAQDLAAGELLAKGLDEFGVRHAISFHRSIAAASGFRDQWDAVGSLVERKTRTTALHVSSKVSTGQRVQLLREFREADAALITNARCLTEGVDVPNVDAVLFADPRRSTVDIVQAVGRALRKSAQKPDKIGYVLLPVLVEDGQTVDDFLESSAFKEVGRVIATLSTHDERIAEEFRADTGGKGERQERGESRILFTGDVPVGVRVDAAEFAEKCRARVWARVGRLNWRPFEEAREWVRGLSLGGYAEWCEYRIGKLANKPPLPPDIPSNANATYANQGWSGYGDWLGTGFVATSKRAYRPFINARTFVHGLSLRSDAEWKRYLRGKVSGLPPIPDDIPRSPAQVYRDSGWLGLGDWLGTGRVAKFDKRYRSFSAAREFARSLQLNTITEWRDYCKGSMPLKPRLPSDIPASPHNGYFGKGWQGYGDWLGTGRVASQNRSFRSFAAAREFVHALKIKSWSEWRRYCAGQLEGLPPLPSDVPTYPNEVYARAGWKGMGDWLGSGRVANQDRTFRPFEAAREFVRALGLAHRGDWAHYCKGTIDRHSPKPDDIPASPAHIYKDAGWLNWGDWLGTGRTANFDRTYRSFDAARQFARSLALTSRDDWAKYVRGGYERHPTLPPDIPRDPSSLYAGKGWNGWSDWLGNGRAPKKRRKPQASP